MSDYEKLLREERARAADEGHGHTVQAIDRVLRLAVPASDPRALALEEAANEADKIAREFSDHGLTAECAASVLVATRIRALSGSESPRAEAPATNACTSCGGDGKCTRDSAPGHVLPCPACGGSGARRGSESPRALGHTSWRCRCGTVNLAECRTCGAGPDERYEATAASPRDQGAGTANLVNGCRCPECLNYVRDGGTHRRGCSLAGRPVETGSEPTP